MASNDYIAGAGLSEMHPLWCRTFPLPEALSFLFVIIVPLLSYDEPKVSLIQTTQSVRLSLTANNVFSKDTVWANYEAIQANIFDHILAVVPEFDLRVYQRPTGADFRVFHEGGQ